MIRSEKKRLLFVISSVLLLAGAAYYLLFSGPDGSVPVAIPAGFDWQGHRGCRGLEPENSIPAFLHALDFPEVTTLELDLAVSKDNQLIVSHEPWFNPDICLLPTGQNIAKGEGEKYLIYQYTAAEIRGFDCGSMGNPKFPQQQKQKTWKPILREVVDSLRAKRPDRLATIRWNVEIKSEAGWDGLRHPAVDVFAQLVIDELRRLGIDAQTTIQSFDVRALQAVHRLAPDIRLVYLVENIWGLESNLEKLGFQPAVYSPVYQVVGPKLARQCHAKGIQLIPWTVDEVVSMRKMIRCGVDGIITDYPDLIPQVEKP